MFREYSIFVAVGLITAVVGEYVTNVLVDPNAGAFIFALSFYAVMLSFAYAWYRRFLRNKTRAALFWYIVFFGIGIGLILSEWIMVGHHPFNPNVSTAIAQISMISFHGSLYFMPVLALHARAETYSTFRTIRNYWLAFGAAALLIGHVISMSAGYEYVLAWGVFSVFFVGYNVLFATLLYRYFWKRGEGIVLQY